MNEEKYYYYPEFINENEMNILKVFPCNLEEIGNPRNPYIICLLKEIKAPFTENFIMADYTRFFNTEEEAKAVIPELLEDFRKQLKQAQEHEVHWSFF